MDKQNVIYTHNGLSFALQRKAVLIDAITQNNIENIILGEKSQSEKVRCYGISLTEILREVKSVEMANGKSGAQGLGEKG